MIRQRVTALAAIHAERARQVEVEGWTTAHDDAHKMGELSTAARCYFEAVQGSEIVPTSWPFEDEAYKPKDRRRNLIRAGALLLAERERLIRLADAEIAKGPETGLITPELAPVQNGLAVVLSALGELDAREIAEEHGDISTRAPDAPEPDASQVEAETADRPKKKGADK